MSSSETGWCPPPVPVPPPPPLVWLGAAADDCDEAIEAQRLGPLGTALAKPDEM